jgi:hypothetical protein
MRENHENAAENIGKMQSVVVNFLIIQLNRNSELSSAYGRLS